MNLRYNLACDQDMNDEDPDDDKNTLKRITDSEIKAAKTHLKKIGETIHPPDS